MFFFFWMFLQFFIWQFLIVVFFQHTLVAVFTLIESYLSYHKEPSEATGLFLLSALFLAYAVFTFYFALVKDYWIYPVMEKLNWPGRIGMVLGGFPLVATLYYVGVYLHLSFWPQRWVQQLKEIKIKNRFFGKFNLR